MLLNFIILSIVLSLDHIIKKQLFLYDNGQQFEVWCGNRELLREASVLATIQNAFY